MKRLLSLFILLAGVGASLLAETVTLTTPGTLHDAVAAPADVTTLTIDGPADASDFAFIASEMDALTALDLFKVTIEAYSGEAINGVSQYPAGTLPAMLLAGMPLQSVALPASLTAIGDGALASTKLSRLVLPASVKSVGAAAFASCTDLTYADTGSAELGAGAFAGCTALTTAATSASAIPERCFAGCTALADVQAADAEQIGAMAFRGCTALKNFAFNPELMKVGERAFASSGLTAADLSGCDHLDEVGAGAFASCPDLTSLALPDREVATGHAVAMGSTALGDVLLASGPVPDYALAGDSTADASAAVSRATSLGAYALKGVSAAQEVVLPAGLESLDDGAMEDMTGLRTIDARALTSVPELGQDVWKGVTPGEVDLLTAKLMSADFLAADQWKDFRIVATGSTGIIDDNDAEGRIRAGFEGTTLIVECTGLPDGSTLTLYDTSGRRLALLNFTPDGRAAVDTSRWTDHVFIVAAADAAGAVLTTFKIARNG